MRFRGGNIRALLFDQYGNLVDVRIAQNFMTTLGEQYLAANLAGGPAPSSMAIGKGVGQTRSDTTLDQLTSIRSLDSGPTQGAGTDANDVDYICDFVAGAGTGVVSEGALFAGATMINYWEFSPVYDKQSGANLVVTVRFTIGVG